MPTSRDDVFPTRDVNEQIVANGGWQVETATVLRKPRARRAWGVFAGSLLLFIQLAVATPMLENHLHVPMRYLLGMFGVLLVALLGRSVHLSRTEAPVQTQHAKQVESDHSANNFDTLY